MGKAAQVPLGLCSDVGGRIPSAFPEAVDRTPLLGRVLRTSFPLPKRGDQSRYNLGMLEK